MLYRILDLIFGKPSHLPPAEQPLTHHTKKPVSGADFMGDKESRCRITCTDRLTGEVTNYPWYKLKDEGYLEEWVESLRGAPMADNQDYMVLPATPGTKTLSSRYDYKIEYEE